MRDGRLHTRLEYATDLFDHETIERFDAQLRTLVEAAVADPDRAVRALPLLTAGERERVLALGAAEGLDAAEGPGRRRARRPRRSRRRRRRARRPRRSRRRRRRARCRRWSRRRRRPRPARRPSSSATSP
nr:hypothetical protein GCM10020093_018070 [Planobispora longispora]